MFDDRGEYQEINLPPFAFEFLLQSLEGWSPLSTALGSWLRTTDVRRVATLGRPEVAHEIADVLAFEGSVGPLDERWLAPRSVMGAWLSRELATAGNCTALADELPNSAAQAHKTPTRRPGAAVVRDPIGFDWATYGGNLVYLAPCADLTDPSRATAFLRKASVGWRGTTMYSAAGPDTWPVEGNAIADAEMVRIVDATEIVVFETFDSEGFLIWRRGAI